ANTGNLSLFVMMTCLNGYFHDATRDSLSESLIKARGGAIAVWASSGMTSPGDQSIMDREMFRHLFEGTAGPFPNSETIGDAARRAKSAATSIDVRRTWILLGDPAMKLR